MLCTRVRIMPTTKYIHRFDEIFLQSIAFIQATSSDELNMLIVEKKIIMMTSSNGDIFRATGHLCGEFIGLWWIPHTKASDAELWCFLFICAWINGWVNNREAGDLRRYSPHYDVTVMWCTVIHSGIWLTYTDVPSGRRADQNILFFKITFINPVINLTIMSSNNRVLNIWGVLFSHWKAIKSGTDEAFDTCTVSHGHTGLR